MKVLVACEESQRVCIAFRAKGHEAYSADIQEPSGGHPEWHILGDVLPLINGNCEFKTMDGNTHIIYGKWDLLIAHPPCTNLCSAGQNWFVRGYKDEKLKQEAFDFFMKFIRADCDKIAVENPVGIVSSLYRKPNQIIQPFWFGEPYTKRTCLWLKNLSPLNPTKVLAKPKKGWENQCFDKDGKYRGFKNFDENGKILAWNNPETAKVRSKTFPGIAAAMAEQWGEKESRQKAAKTNLQCYYSTERTESQWKNIGVTAAAEF